jgi:CRP-like cAMP-binding protein
MRTRDPRIDLLRTIPGLKGQSDRALAALAPLLDEIAFSPGDRLTREGVSGHEAFIILDGDAEVFVDGQSIATLGRGDFVGEIAMLDHAPRTATVRANTPLRALVVGPRAFGTFIENGGVLQSLATQLAQRLRQADTPPTASSEPTK